MKPAWIVAERSINQAEARWINKDHIAKFKSPAKHLLKRCRKPSFRQHRTMLRGEWWPVPRPPRRPKSPRLQGIVLRWLRDTPF